MLTYKQISTMTKPYSNMDILRVKKSHPIKLATFWSDGFIALREPAPTKLPKSFEEWRKGSDSALTDMDTGATTEIWPVELIGGEDLALTYLRLTDGQKSYWADPRYVGALLKRDKKASLFVNPSQYCIAARNGHTVGLLMLMTISETNEANIRRLAAQGGWTLRNEDIPLRPFTPLQIGTSAEVREACLQVAVNGQLVPLIPLPQPVTVTPEPEPIAKAAQEPCSRCKGTGKVGDLDWRRLISIFSVCHGTGHKTEPEPAIVAEPVTESEPEPQPVAVTVPELSKVDRLAVALAGLGVTEIYTDNGQTCAVWERVDLPAQQALRRTVTGTLKGAGFSVRARYEGSALYITC